MAPLSLVHLEPAAQLVFSVTEPCGRASNKLKLTNTSAVMTAWKVRTTAPQAVFVTPHSGVLRPGASVEAVVRVVPESCTGDLRFEVRATEAEDGAVNWARVPESALQTAQLEGLVERASPASAPPSPPAATALSTPLQGPTPAPEAPSPTRRGARPQAKAPARPSTVKRAPAQGAAPTRPPNAAPPARKVRAAPESAQSPGVAAAAEPGIEEDELLERFRLIVGRARCSERAAAPKLSSGAAPSPAPGCAERSQRRSKRPVATFGRPAPAVQRAAYSLCSAVQRRARPTAGGACVATDVGDLVAKGAMSALVAAMAFVLYLRPLLCYLLDDGSAPEAATAALTM